MSDPNAPIDEAILKAIARTLRTDDQVVEVVLIAGEGTAEHKHLAVTFDPARYPAPVREANLEIQWYRNDGFNMHYTETHIDDIDDGGSNVWQCRWDRQSSTHSTREHFHPPPDAGEPTDSRFPDDYRSVLSMVLAAVRARIEELWQDYEETS
ncbi:hypothetical protein [Halococcus salsus]|uniref:hypothetical protein n=1 Tax=Halococcus salsus TaxID=2162894 RepID=UPI00135B9472|nr:hypothetical protein [Halococcus salsus]